MQSEDFSIENRVANSALETFNLEDHYPIGQRITLDLSQWLHEGFILREKDFRAALKAHDWSQYQGQHLALFCSTDSIIPAWAHILVTAQLGPFTSSVVVGDLEALESHLYQTAMAQIDWTPYQDKAVIIKGCSQKPVPKNAYLWAMTALQKVAKSVMYGEACSAVPLYKQKK
ncbi:DUF2480 family protein [Flavobacteriaceae bacterium]|nr:DUF2480 family protein [Flavobacteriaceae bacterium]